MPIVPSRAERTRALVRQLSSERAADRDSAVAQLTLAGPRVIGPLRDSLAEAPARARLAALEVLERLDDPSALPSILELVDDSSPSVSVRALELAGGLPDAASVSALAGALATPPLPRQRAAAAALAALHQAGIVEALAPLVDTLLDEQEDPGLRLLLLDTVARLELPRRTLQPLARRLATSTEPGVAGRAGELGEARPGTTERDDARKDVVDRLASGTVTRSEARRIAADLDGRPEPPLDRLREALEHTDDPRAVPALAVVLETVGGPAAIPAFKRVLGRLAEAPADGGDPAERLAARAAVHAALAALDSRVALHDLRELIVLRPSTLMPGLLDAAARVGDASLVPALARAATEDPSLLDACAATYGAIARRERLRRTSSALRKVKAEHRAALDAFTSSGKAPGASRKRTRKGAS